VAGSKKLLYIPSSPPDSEALQELMLCVRGKSDRNMKDIPHMGELIHTGG
jgi:hypothetical protein